MAEDHESVSLKLKPGCIHFALTVCFRNILAANITQCPNKDGETISVHRS